MIIGIIILLLLFIYFVYEYCNRKQIEYFTQEKQDIKYKDAERVIYCLWTGTNKMSNNRKHCLDNLKKHTGVPVIFITVDNLDKYILKNEPLHSGYQYLSEVHKADYLRTYFMRFYGGGYSDIKETTGDWNDSFTLLNNSDKWIIGYKEIEGGVAYQPLYQKWKDLIGNGAYICKPGTPLVKEWYNDMIKLMDKKLEELKKNPSSDPRDQKEHNTGYPIEWNELLGRIFHRKIYKNKDKILNSLPIVNTNDYL